MPLLASQVRPTPIAEVIERVRAGIGDASSLVLAVSSLTFGGKAQLRRIGVFVDRDNQVVELVDTHVSNSLGEELYEALSELAPVEIGGWDAHFADGWNWVWSRTAERLALWHRADGLCCTVSPAGLEYAGASYAWTDLDHVETWVSDDMVRRQVRVSLPEAEPVVLAEEEDGVALIDPTYDWVMLDAETGWLVELAQATAMAMNKPYFDQRRR